MLQWTNVYAHLESSCLSVDLPERRAFAEEQWLLCIYDNPVEIRPPASMRLSGLKENNKKMNSISLNHRTIGYTKCLNYFQRGRI